MRSKIAPSLVKPIEPLKGCTSSASQVRRRLARLQACRLLPACPPAPQQVLHGHEDEVWHVAFSPCGTLLASASRDGTARVYDVRGRGAVALRHILRGHTGPIAFLSWAPKGGLLATCGEEKRGGVSSRGRAGQGRQPGQAQEVVSGMLSVECVLFQGRHALVACRSWCSFPHVQCLGYLLT